jgi:hypothetical protein
MVSFDGERHPSLSENHFARVDEPNSIGKDGSWSFDESSGKYTITVHDDSAVYSAVAPGDGYNCMLIKGDAQAADLARSWFYSHADFEDQGDPALPDR